MVKKMVNFWFLAAIWRFCLKGLQVFFEAVEGFCGDSDLVGKAWRVMAGLFFQFQSERNLAAGQRAKELERLGPIDGAIVGRKMRVFVTHIVVDVRADDVLAHGFKTCGDALVLR